MNIINFAITVTSIITEKTSSPILHIPYLHNYQDHFYPIQQTANPIPLVVYLKPFYIVLPGLSIKI
ncbi:MAG: hypothetical protein K2M91_02370, partial [Lachnospiraceae bacterium]|nr:hypothetical protein [Lachnospiraceae bacterium]